MRVLFALVCTSLLLAIPASAREAGWKQMGFVCNKADAAAAAAFFVSYRDEQDDMDAITSLVSSPESWCIPGFVRPSRPAIAAGGIEDVLALVRESDFEFNEVSSSIAGLVAFQIPVVGNLISAAMTLLPTQITDLGLREFERENGQSGFYVVRRSEPHFSAPAREKMH
jgi:hypothetical protein